MAKPRYHYGPKLPKHGGYLPRPSYQAPAVDERPAWKRALVQLPGGPRLARISEHWNKKDYAGAAAIPIGIAIKNYKHIARGFAAAKRLRHVVAERRRHVRSWDAARTPIRRNLFPNTPQGPRAPRRRRTGLWQAPHGEL